MHTVKFPGSRRKVRYPGRPKAVVKRRNLMFKDEEEDFGPGPNTLARTKRLLLAALRVWELKHGIRD